MPTPEHLTINGYSGDAVPNVFTRQTTSAQHLAILLPGFGYTCDMPLFYYAENLLVETGADLLRVEYAYNRRPDFAALPQSDQRRWLVTDTIAAYQSGLAQRAYRDVTLIGKSLGTLAMGHLLTTQPAPPGRARAVWLTPMLSEATLREQLDRFAGRSLVAIGTADPHYDAAYLDDLRATTGAEIVAIEGADHGLDIPGDPVTSVRAVERVVRALQTFLAP